MGVEGVGNQTTLFTDNCSPQCWGWLQTVWPMSGSTWLKPFSRSPLLCQPPLSSPKLDRVLRNLTMILISMSATTPQKPLWVGFDGLELFIKLTICLSAY